MLGFVVPIKSPKVSKSWQTVSLLFERTARSICNQTNPNFRVIVVCDEQPDPEFKHPKLDYITIPDLPVPTTWVEKHGDKMYKVIRGIERAKELDCSHIMLVDSDDCVSNRLAECVSKNIEAYGYVFESGYRYKNNSDLIRVMRKGFHQYCGTSHIIRSDFYDLSDERLANLPNPITSLDQLPKDIHDLYYAHRRFAQAMDVKGASLEPLPFIGAVYIYNNTENISVNFHLDKQKNMSIKSRILRLKATLFDHRLLTPQLKEELGLYELHLPN
jgi:hypothetical protein